MGRVRSCQIHDAEYDSPKIYHVIDKAEFWCLVEVCCLRLEWRCPAPKVWTCQQKKREHVAVEQTSLIL